MTTPIPTPLRAAAGLAAVAIDSARRLPEQLVGLPVLAVSAALQASLKTQQRYAELVARGDQLLGQLQGQADGTPAWARFDDEPGPGGAAPGSGRPPSAFDAAPESGEELLDWELAGEELLDGGLAGEELLDGGLAGEELLAEAAADLLGSGEADLGSLADAEAVTDGLAAGTRPAADDGYLVAEPPVAGYDQMSIPQLRGRLRTLTEAQVERLVAYERANGARAPHLTMLENRLTTLRSS